MSLAIYVDMALAALLVATVFYAARLNRRLGMLRRDRGELTALIAKFNAATAAAEAAMEGLRASADSSGRTLQDAVEKARDTARELGFLVDRGERAADRIDIAIRSGRGIERAAPAGEGPAADTASSSAPREAGRSPGGDHSAVEVSPRPGPASRSAGTPDRAALLRAIERME